MVGCDVQFQEVEKSETGIKAQPGLWSMPTLGREFNRASNVGIGIFKCHLADNNFGQSQPRLCVGRR
jgi:hypothetical protein